MAATLIGEIESRDIFIEVDAKTYLYVNKYIAEIESKNIKDFNRELFIGKMFIAIKEKGKELNEDSIKCHISGKSTKKQPAEVI